jgi:predicted enzyme related to lactoylglutathione lyase
MVSPRGAASAQERSRRQTVSDHPIVHVEIPARDLKEVSQFYTEVFGWQIDSSSMEGYPMFAAEGGPGGGFVQVSDVSHTVGRPLLFIGTDDIDASLAAVEAHGGKTIMPRTAIPHVGWWAVFADSSDNTLALFTRDDTAKNGDTAE